MPVLKKWRNLDLFRKFALVVGVVMVARFSYLTIAWLISSHPVGALVPGVLVYFLASNVYLYLKYGTAQETIVHLTGTYLIAGPASALSIVILWILAREDAVYRDQAVTMSIWGGAIVIPAALLLVKIATPRGRKNMRDQREAVARGEDPWSKPSS